MQEVKGSKVGSVQNYPWEPVIYVYVYGLIAGMSGVLIPACSPFLKARGLHEEQFSWLFVILLGSAVVAAIARSTFAARVPLHAAFATGALLVMVSQGLIGHSGRMERESLSWLLITACIIQGVGGSLLGISGNNSAVCLFPQRRAFALGLFHASAGIGATLGPALVASFGEQLWWRAPQLVASVLLVGGIWGFARGRNWGLHLGNSVHAESTAPSPSNSQIRWLTIALLYGICEATIMYWSVLCLVEHGKLPPLVADRALATFWLAMTLARLGLSWFYRVCPRYFSLGLHLGCLAISFWILGSAKSYLVAVCAMSMAGFAASVVYPQVMAAATESSARNTSRIVAWITLATTIGQAIGAWLTGQLAERIGFDRAFFMASAWGLLGCGVALWASSFFSRPGTPASLAAGISRPQ